MAKSAVGADLFQALKILAQFSTQVVREGLHVLACLPFTLPVQEPVWDLELLRALNDRNELFNFVLCKFASPVRRRNENI